MTRKLVAMNGAEHVAYRQASRGVLAFAVASSLVVVAIASLLIYNVFFSAGPVAVASAETPKGRPIVVAIVRTPGGPSEWITYARAIKRMSEATGRPMRVRYVQERGSITHLIESHQVDAGFLCTACYLDLAEQHDITLVATPRIAGEDKDAAVLVVRSSSRYLSLKQLVGHRVGVTDPTSLAGNAYLHWLAKREGLDVARSFTVVQADTQECNLRALLAGDVDAVVVNRSQLALWDPTEVKVISQSPEYGMPPFVTGSTIDSATRAAMKQALLTMPVSTERPLPAVEGFSAVTAKDYEFARELLRLSTSLRGPR